ncbi:hypothetical protein PHLGIDRAFT_31107 [Phlebiopsis gigantea 11061_1 CR5-6]|uniref:Uncharacterized protein n=1 Tax=Phlebiopsis gigantea (strain 11061_1 CR5-6) TaxID=745531 RepID=A0A0C3NJ72_PHLG1|nr:hypothetical protein PHLGIDRAFT_31107 [Phlebiopsis gigantea 11061_1 CR5-6]
MPPQPGVFALPYSSTHKSRVSNGALDNGEGPSIYHPSNLGAGPSRNHGQPVEDPKGKKRKELAGRLSREHILDGVAHFTSGRHYNEAIQDLMALAYQLATHPELVPAYQLRLYPLSLERSALLASLQHEEQHALQCVQTAYEEERERVDDEWRRGREKIKERLLEGIEERRRRAREDKEGEGTAADATLDSQSRPHITRKLRNKLGGTSPPPTPLASNTPGGGGISSIAQGPITTGPFLNPHSLSVDELPSPFPLPLTSAHLNTNVGANGTSNRRRAKGSGREAQTVGGLGKSLQLLLGCKEQETEADLGEIRRTKRRRVAAGGGGGAKS